MDAEMFKFGIAGLFALFALNLIKMVLPYVKKSKDSESSGYEAILTKQTIVLDRLTTLIEKMNEREIRHQEIVESKVISNHESLKNLALQLQSTHIGVESVHKRMDKMKCEL